MRPTLVVRYLRLVVTRPWYRDVPLFPAISLFYVAVRSAPTELTRLLMSWPRVS
jgi:hypothetical protein